MLFDDSDRWLEQDVEIIAQDIAAQGKVVKAVGPIIESFDQFCEASR